MQIQYEKYDLHRFLPSLRFQRESKLIDRLQPPDNKLLLATAISICNQNYADFLVTLKALLKNLYFLISKFERIDEERIVIFLIHDGIEKVSMNFLDDAQGRIIKKKHFDKIKQKTMDQSLLGRPFSLNYRFNEDRSNSSSQVIVDGDMREGAIQERREQDDNSSDAESDLDPENKVPVTTHALKKWNQTKTIHCFQTLTSLNMFNEIKDRNDLLLFCKGHVPAIKFVYAIKESNMGKLDSHRHFFTGFCEELHPRYCSLIDVGTTFDDHTYFGYIHMGEIKKQLGGISQEVETMWEWNPLVISQFIDYKLDQILKSAEGLYGLVQILPGAHQFLKWRGVRGKALNIYMEGTEERNYEEKKDSLGIFKRNVFLTEDKLMTALLVLRDDQVHTVEYLPGAKAYTDVPSNTAAILRQRRRWLNGGFSTTVYGLSIYCKQYRRSQMRKKHPCIGIMLFLQLLYHFLQIFVQTSVAMDIITTYKFLLFVEEKMKDGTLIPGLGGIGLLNIIFIWLIIFVFVLALVAKSRHKNIVIIYEILSYCLMVINILKMVGIFMGLHLTLTNQASEQETILLVMGIITLYFSIFNFLILFCIKPRQICTRFHKFLISVIFYLLFQNTFFLMVKLYLVCNYHDVSWGSRALNKKRAAEIEKKYKLSTLIIILVWLLFNFILILLIEFFHQNLYFIIAMGVLVFIWITVRAVQALIYWLNYCRSLRFKLYGQFLKTKVIYEDRPKKLQFKNYQSTFEGPMKNRPPLVFVNQKRDPKEDIKLKDIKLADKNQQISSLSSQTIFTVVRKDMDDINSSENQVDSKSKKNDSPDLRGSYASSGGFMSRTSNSFNMEGSSADKESQLRFEGSLFSKQSSIPGVDSETVMRNSSLNRTSFNRSRQLRPDSEVDSLWDKKSGLIQQEEKKSVSSRNQSSKLNFDGERSLWGGQSSIIQSEDLNPYSSSFNSQTTENKYRGSAGQSESLWDKQSSLPSSGSEVPISSSNPKKRKFKRNGVHKQSIPEEESEYKEEDYQVNLRQKGSILDQNQQDHPIQQKDKASKSSGDPFKSSFNSTEKKSESRSKQISGVDSSSFFQSKSEESNKEDSFEVQGGQISDELSKGEGQVSVIESKQKSNPRSSLKSSFAI